MTEEEKEAIKDLIDSSYESLLDGTTITSNKAINTILNLIEKLQKENEELKEKIREHTLLISPYYVKENYIPVQIVKDKIEELNKKEKEELKGMKGQDRYFVKQTYQNKKMILQELIKESED